MKLMMEISSNDNSGQQAYCKSEVIYLFCDLVSIIGHPFYFLLAKKIFLQILICTDKSLV
jgi:hypothetical protein